MKLADGVIGPARSLRRRLTINIVVAMTICVALAGAIMIAEFYEHLEENTRAALFYESRELLGQVDPDRPNYGLDPDALRIRGIEGTYRYTLFNGEGDAVVGGETSRRIQEQLVQLRLGQAAEIDLPGDRVGVAIRARIDGEDVYVLASTFPPGTNESRFHQLMHEIRERLWWVVIGFVLIITAAWLATRRALEPLEALSQQAHAIGPTETDKRLTSQGVPSEIRPLIQAVNSAFDRLEQGLNAQRDFSSNVAHEIRTPLAVLRSSIDRITDPELQASLAEDLSRLDLIFEQLIDLARADASRGANFTPVHLREVVLEQAVELGAEALRAGRPLAINGEEDCPVEGHAGLLGIAVKNLVRNALRYAPRDTEVEIEVSAHPPAIRVLDRGPGVPDALKAGLFERFNRGRASPQSNGSGIGLAIVQSVARAHGAQVSVSDRPGGGSIFAMTWPPDADKG